MRSWTLFLDQSTESSHAVNECNKSRQSDNKKTKQNKTSRSLRRLNPQSCGAQSRLAPGQVTLVLAILESPSPALIYCTWVRPFLLASQAVVIECFVDQSLQGHVGTRTTTQLGLFSCIVQIVVLLQSLCWQKPQQVLVRKSPLRLFYMSSGPQTRTCGARERGESCD